jgi:hypothetical protein
MTGTSISISKESPIAILSGVWKVKLDFSAEGIHKAF